QLWIQPLNAFQTCACEFNRRYFLFLDSTAGRGQIKQGQVARGAIHSRRHGNSENTIEDRGVTWLISQASKRASVMRGLSSLLCCKHMPCCAIGAGMGMRAEFNGAGIAAARGENKRRTEAARSLEDHAITLDQSLGRERKAAKRIGSQRIDARLIKDNVRTGAECGRKHLIEAMNVCLVFNAIRQGYVEAALL